MSDNIRYRIARVAAVLESMVVAAKTPDHTAKSLKTHFQNWTKKLGKGIKIESLKSEDVTKGDFSGKSIVSYRVVPKKGDPFLVEIVLNWEEDKSYTGSVKVGNPGTTTTVRGTTMDQWIERIKDAIEPKIVKLVVPVKPKK